MKKLLFIFTLMLCALSVNAQTDATKTVENEEYAVYCDLSMYCILVAYPTVSLDFGDSKYATIYDENGKKKKFYGVIDAVNYMAKRGWKVQTTYRITKDGDIHYLLYKMVKDDKEKYEGLKLEK